MNKILYSIIIFTTLFLTGCESQQLQIPDRTIFGTGTFVQKRSLKKGIPEDKVWLMKIGETRKF